ncbi:glycosyltransferase family 2 protein [Frigoribacterium sp. CFBP 13712]|uniref:glycosyltransferase family 2 protein n=1 Tax=Frigoribacterium sp. CFBP 13712 TaxID=2775309 RepID=UPI00352FE901
MVIVNYNSSELIGELLTDISPTWCARVVIVDNSDDANEFERVQRLCALVKVDALQAPGNIGFGAGVNLGVEHALADRNIEYVWVLNPDTRVRANAPTVLINHLRAHHCDVVSPAVTTGARDEVIWFAGGSIDPRHGTVRHWRYDEPSTSLPSDPFATIFMCGAAPLFRREAWQQLHGFDESLFLYWEDAELSLRAADLGLRMEILPTARVWHAVGGTSAETGQSRAFYYYSARNRVRVMRKRSGIWAIASPVGILATAKFTLRPLRRESASPVAKSWAALRGHISGLL